MRRNPGVALLLMVFSVAALSAQSPSADERAAMLRGIDAKRDKYAGVAKEIWGFAEVGYQEQKSSALLQQRLKAAGFQVTAGVAGIPTAFVATFGSGKPVPLSRSADLGRRGATREGGSRTVESDESKADIQHGA
jgi:aminobenzoyl-glutamate utilization protein B